MVYYFFRCGSCEMPHDAIKPLREFDYLSEFDAVDVNCPMFSGAGFVNSEYVDYV
ncbi:hypothetical protein SMG44B_10568 [Stenotrophomonas maltophilia]